jgi:hypothetical protein
MKNLSKNSVKKENLIEKIKEEKPKIESSSTKETKKIIQEKKESQKIIIEVPRITPEKIIKFPNQTEFKENNWEVKSPKIEIPQPRNLETSVVDTSIKKRKDSEEEKEKYSKKTENKDEPKYFSSPDLNKVEYLRSSEISRIESNPWDNQSILKKRNVGLLESSESRINANPQQEKYTPASVFEKEILQERDMTKKKEIKYRPSAIS